VRGGGTLAKEKVARKPAFAKMGYQKRREALGNGKGKTRKSSRRVLVHDERYEKKMHLQKVQVWAAGENGAWRKKLKKPQQREDPEGSSLNGRRAFVATRGQKACDRLNRGKKPVSYHQPFSRGEGGRPPEGGGVELGPGKPEKIKRDKNPGTTIKKEGYVKKIFPIYKKNNNEEERRRTKMKGSPPPPGSQLVLEGGGRFPSERNFLLLTQKTAGSGVKRLFAKEGGGAGRESQASLKSP